MLRKHLVSVIMPVYNSEKYLAQAIESILKQTYSYFELIIIYDKSEDNSLKIINEYVKKDNRIVLLVRDKGTIVSALNDGIAVAKGEYIARMDADDIAIRNRFEKQVEFLNLHKDVYLLGTNYSLIIEEEAREEDIQSCLATHRRSRDVIDRENSFFSSNEIMKFIHPTIMLRKKVFDLVGPYKEMMLEDLELYFRIGKNGFGIAKLEDDLLEYRVTATSKSRKESRREQTRQLIKEKLKYVLGELSDETKKKPYMIWGADISGEEALKLLREQLKGIECIAYIDSFKSGSLNGIQIISPESIEDYDFGYVFICTQGGARYARDYMKKIGKKELYDYFKIS